MPCHFSPHRSGDSIFEITNKDGAVCHVLIKDIYIYVVLVDPILS